MGQNEYSFGLVFYDDQRTFQYNFNIFILSSPSIVFCTFTLSSWEKRIIILNAVENKTYLTYYMSIATWGLSPLHH